MAVHLSAKPAGATQLYSWKPDLADGDGIASFDLTGNTVGVVASEQQGDEIAFYVSGGTAGNVYTIDAEVETSNGESLRETLYIPVFGPGNAFSYTAQDIIDFAFRPISGLSEGPETVESEDALEWLNDFLAEWREQGADIGVALPLAVSDILYCRDAHVRAVKTNLRVDIAEQYGRQVAPRTALAAMRGLQQIKWANLPTDRTGPDYY
jgi:hypothetical protein